MGVIVKVTTGHKCIGRGKKRNRNKEPFYSCLKKKIFTEFFNWAVIWEPSVCLRSSPEQRSWQCSAGIDIHGTVKAEMTEESTRCDHVPGNKCLISSCWSSQQRLQTGINYYLNWAVGRARSSRALYATAETVTGALNSLTQGTTLPGGPSNCGLAFRKHTLG